MRKAQYQTIYNLFHVVRSNQGQLCGEKRDAAPQGRDSSCAEEKTGGLERHPAPPQGGGVHSMHWVLGIPGNCLADGQYQDGRRDSESGDPLVYLRHDEPKFMLP